MIPAKPVDSIEQFIDTVRADYAEWGTEQFPWFRGEPGDTQTPLLPKIYRQEHDENALLQFFRMKAPVLGLPIIPDRTEIDKWLFVARHVGLPTRLLDWTEGALIALYFALQEKLPVVWMLNPYELNRKSAKDTVPNAPTITWDGGRTGNIGHMNVLGAWEQNRIGTDLPVAIHPTNIHPLMSAQHSCFTIHGKKRESLCDLVGAECLRRYEIRMDSAAALRELRTLGISHSTLFPDPMGLAIELEDFF